MIEYQTRKSLILANKEVHRFSLPNERQTRRVVSDLVFDGIIYAPLKKNVYVRVNELSELSDLEKIEMNRYIGKELKSAIKLIRRVKKLQKFMTNEQLKELLGELL